MVLQLLVLVVVWLTGVGGVSSPLVVRPDCNDTCGNISIPYPFGIGANCAYNHDFAITCNNSFNPSKPFFTSNNLEVRDISLSDATVNILHPVLASDCPNRTNDDHHRLVNLSSLFWFSNESNVFAATGCNNLALMRSQGQKIIGGCASICDGGTNSTDREGCYGINCCQAAVPPLLNFINTSLTSVTSLDSKTTSGSKYAFIVDEGWFNDLLMRDPHYDIQKIERVLAVLDWAIDGECNDTLCGPNANCTSWTNFTHYCTCTSSYGNPYLPNGCPGRPAVEKTRIIFIGISTVFGLILLLIGTWWLYKLLKRRRKLMLRHKFFNMLLQQQLSSGDQGNVEKIKIFTLKELEKATDHFNENRILGQGGQGTVYKGMLNDGRIVAVKKSKIVDESKLEQFINEVVILSQINHRNVVKLHGCCLGAEVLLLVYEYIPNGTLYQYIHEQNEEFPLTWDLRVRIAIEVSGALSYLHSAASIPIYHRDIKSTNILLDEKFTAKVADFGTSKLIAIDQTHMTTLVQGTFGYLDPEYFQSSQFTEKSDVYSFGVVLVELLTGQKPISLARSEEWRSLVAYFMFTMNDNRLFDILDARVLKEGGKEKIARVANLTKRCLNLSGRKRPTMKEVAIELEGIRMSHGLSTIQQNYEEDDEYVVNELTVPWDAASTSTWYHLDISVSSSRDAHPLLFE